MASTWLTTVMCICAHAWRELFKVLKGYYAKVVVAKVAVLAEGLCPVVTELGACPGAKTERDEKETGEH